MIRGGEIDEGETLTIAHASRALVIELHFVAGEWRGYYPENDRARWLAASCYTWAAGYALAWARERCLRLEAVFFDVELDDLTVGEVVSLHAIHGGHDPYQPVALSLACRGWSYWDPILLRWCLTVDGAAAMRRHSTVRSQADVVRYATARSQGVEAVDRLVAVGSRLAQQALAGRDRRDAWAQVAAVARLGGDPEYVIAAEILAL